MAILFDDKIITDRLSVTNNQYRELVEGEFVDTATEILGGRAGLTEDQRSVLENGFILYLLAFINRDGLTEFISEECELEKKEALHLALAFEQSLPEGAKEGILSAYHIFNNKVDPQTNDPNILVPKQIIDSIHTGVSTPQPTHPGQEPIEPQDTQMFGDHSDKEPVAPPVQQTAVTADTSTTSQESIAPLPQEYGETPAISEPHKVEQMHTMEKDIDKIHGYGAYRKMYPDTSSKEADDSSVNEEIRHATSQEDVLKRTPLTGTPSYTDTEK